MQTRKFLLYWYDIPCQICLRHFNLQTFFILEFCWHFNVFVHFTRVLELIHEAKWMTRLGIQIPDSAMSVMEQEARFKNYKAHLQLVLSDYRSVDTDLLMHLRNLIIFYSPFYMPKSHICLKGNKGYNI